MPQHVTYLHVVLVRAHNVTRTSTFEYLEMICFLQGYVTSIVVPFYIHDGETYGGYLLAVSAAVAALLSIPNTIGLLSDLRSKKWLMVSPILPVWMTAVSVDGAGIGTCCLWYQRVTPANHRVPTRGWPAWLGATRALYTSGAPSEKRIIGDKPAVGVKQQNRARQNESKLRDSNRVRRSKAKTEHTVHLQGVGRGVWESTNKAIFLDYFAADKVQPSAKWTRQSPTERCTLNPDTQLMLLISPKCHTFIRML